MDPINNRLRRPNSKNKELISDPTDNELLIDEHNLNQELIDQPLYFRKYTKILANLNKKAKYTKMRLEQHEASLYVKYSNDGQGRKVKEIESLVNNDLEVLNLKNELIEAEGQVNEFEGIVKAFHQRFEMLKDLCANRRRDLVD